MSGKPRRISIHLAISTVGVCLILFTSLAIGITSYVNAKRLAGNMAERIFSGAFREITFMAAAKLDHVDAVLESNRALLSEGFVDPEDFESLGEHFVGVLISHPYLTETGYGDSRGWAVWAERSPEGQLTLFETIPRQGKPAKQIVRKCDSEGNVVSREETEIEYDPRDRPWYTSAVEAEGPVWTDPYVFISGVPGLSRAWRFASDTGEIVGVFDASFELDFLSNYLVDTKGDRLGQMFILNLRRGGEIIAHPDPSVIVDRSGSDQVIPSIDAIGDHRLEVVRDLMESEGKSVQGEERVRERVKIDGEAFILIAQKFSPGSKLGWFTVFFVPENEILGPVHRNNRIAFLVGLGATLIGILIAFLFSQRLSRRLRVLSDEIEDVGKLIISNREPKVSMIQEVDVLEKSVNVMKVGLRSFRKFVPAELVRSLLDRGIVAKLEGRREELTIFFTDIIGYTTICEEISPETLVSELGRYLEEMTAVIESEKGTVNQYVGDAIMAIFGAPVPVKRHALRACRAALAFVERNDQLVREAEKEGRPVFRSRVGINTGEVIVGNLGSPNRLYFTANGDQVNLAARLESINGVYGTRIVMGEGTRSLVGDAMVSRLLDFVAVKGRKQGVAIYELVGESGKVDEEMLGFIRKYELGITSYLSRDWEEAILSFENCLKLREDQASLILLERCRSCRKSPPGEDWNGVFEMAHK